MEIVDRGTVSRAEAGGPRAILTFPSVTLLGDGSLVASLRSGSGKDSADETVELHRSTDLGRTWSGPLHRVAPTRVGGRSGSLKVAYLTELAPGRLLAAAMWVDRESYPGKPLFDTATEGCLPMVILLAESGDGGRSWGAWRSVDMPVEIGPPSLTSPILMLPDGTLGMSIETNKTYQDTSKWYQRVVYFRSPDQGRSWTGPFVSGADPTGRIFNWDQRAAVAPDGRLAAFAWTYDSETCRYLNVHRRISLDSALSWSPAEDLGFADQPSHPAIFPDGRTILAWVDRFGSRAIRARRAADVAAPFDAGSEVVLYAHEQSAGSGSFHDDTGGMLGDMALWSFGLPYAEALPDGTALVVYYAGTPAAMDVRFARLRP